ncbi:hypothetical protein AAFF_G00083050 [Aldrovandia affinis]|uniref:Pleckstrin homology domain-containing family G member 7 n=1 Tax=Aldrovandia affinis TaxID=143900 RepID=A0AAD7WCY3_9TELE|nr:hypothetical protein AAFF_G00083050 [Aldrovandia affinis]
MSSVKEATIVSENGQNIDETLEWSYIELKEQEDGSTGICCVETQTATVSTEDKETQTTHPIIMRIDLPRTPSKLNRASLLETDGVLVPLFQLDRHAPARISTSPTLRRMRKSTRRPQMDFRDPVGEDVGQVGSVAGETSPESPLSPVRRPMSPLAASPLSHSELDQGCQSVSPAIKEKNRSRRSNTVDNGVTFRRLENDNIDCASTEDPDQETESSNNRLQERRRSSVVVSLPGLDMSPGDLFVSDGSVGLLNGSRFSESKKSKWPFSRSSTIKGKMRSASDIEKCLSTAQIQDWGDRDFQRYKNCSLEDFLKGEGHEDRAQDGVRDWRKEKAVWELFTSECIYFLDQLLVLKEVFLSTLTYLQDNDCLPDIEPWRLFANLNELSLVSFGFLTGLLRAIRDSWEIPVSGGVSTLQALLTKGFSEKICHSQQKYCLNYPTAVSYLDSLKQREDFATYVKWCERNQECRRLYLRDLLVAPLQRCTRYPLLLRNIGKRSSSEEEKRAVQVVVDLVERSIHELEGKVKWLDNYQKVKRLKESLVWEPVWDRDRRAFVPENLRHLMKTVSLENLVAHRSLLHEGRLVLTENAKQQDVYLFLFDEFLLITKMKRNKKKSSGSEPNSPHAVVAQELQVLLKEGCTFTVLDQPLSLDRIQLRNIDQLNATASGLLNSFIITHQNRYLQCIAVFVLQASSESIKKAWIVALEGAVEALLKQESQQPRLRNSLWLESSQI